VLRRILLSATSLRNFYLSSFVSVNSSANIFPGSHVVFEFASFGSTLRPWSRAVFVSVPGLPGVGWFVERADAVAKAWVIYTFRDERSDFATTTTTTTMWSVFGARRQRGSPPRGRRTGGGKRRRHGSRESRISRAFLLVWCLCSTLFHAGFGVVSDGINDKLMADFAKVDIADLAKLQQLQTSWELNAGDDDPKRISMGLEMCELKLKVVQQLTVPEDLLLQAVNSLAQKRPYLKYYAGVDAQMCQIETQVAALGHLDFSRVDTKTLQQYHDSETAFEDHDQKVLALRKKGGRITDSDHLFLKSSPSEKEKLREEIGSRKRLLNAQLRHGFDERAQKESLSRVLDLKEFERRKTDYAAATCTAVSAGINRRFECTPRDSTPALRKQQARVATPAPQSLHS